MQRLFDTNVFGAARVIQAVLPGMKRRRRGHIVVISSVMGLQGEGAGGRALGLLGVPPPRPPRPRLIATAGIVFNDVYAASKFAVEGLCESLAVQLLQFNIYISMVEPGPVKTDFELKLMEEVARDEFAGADADTVRYFREVYVPAARDIFATLGQSPEEVAEVVARVVASPRPAFRTQTNALYTPLVALKYADPTGELSVRSLHRMLFRHGSLLRLSMA
ncbi:RDH8 dehydrogenase, partial [Nothocercus julius]|nr:RDH8 dehydrogenase [Nothocercus julius]